MVSVVKSKKDQPVLKRKSQNLLSKGGIKKKKRNNAVKVAVKSLENKGPEILKSGSVMLRKTLPLSPNEKKAGQIIAPVPEKISPFQKKLGKRADISLKRNKRGKIKEQGSTSKDSRKTTGTKFGKNVEISLTEDSQTPKVKKKKQNKKQTEQDIFEKEQQIEQEVVEKEEQIEQEVIEKEQQIHSEQFENDKTKYIVRTIMKEYLEGPESSIGKLIQTALELEKRYKISENHNSYTKRGKVLPNDSSTENADLKENGLKSLIPKVVEEYFVSQFGEEPDFERLIQNVIDFEKQMEVTKEMEGVVKNLSRRQVRKVLEALTTSFKRREYPKTEELIFDEPMNIFVQFSCVKMAKTPTREIRLTLPHCLIHDTGEVCVIVHDLKKGRRADFEPTIQYFQDLFRTKGVTKISQIVPFCQLRTDYELYEMKRALCGRFDAFLVDSSICGHVSHVLGTTFIRRRKIPVPVDLSKKDLSEVINRALRRTSFRMSRFSNTFCAKVGHSKMSLKQLYDNVLAFCYQLPDVFPGGCKNIRCFRIKGEKTPSLPFYLSEVERHMVRVPVVKPRRPKAYKKVKSELDYFGQVVVYPDGTVTAKYKRDYNDKILRSGRKSSQQWAPRQMEEDDLENDAIKDEEMSAFKHRLLQLPVSGQFEKENNMSKTEETFTKIANDKSSNKKSRPKKLRTLERMYLGDHVLNEEIEAEEERKKIHAMKIATLREKRKVKSGKTGKKAIPNDKVLPGKGKTAEEIQTSHRKQSSKNGEKKQVHVKFERKEKQIKQKRPKKENQMKQKRPKKMGKQQQHSI